LPCDTPTCARYLLHTTGSALLLGTGRLYEQAGTAVDMGRVAAGGTGKKNAATRDVARACGVNHHATYMPAACVQHSISIRGICVAWMGQDRRTHKYGRTFHAQFLAAGNFFCSSAFTFYLRYLPVTPYVPYRPWTFPFCSHYHFLFSASPCLPPPPFVSVPLPATFDRYLGNTYHTTGCTPVTLANASRRYIPATKSSSAPRVPFRVDAPSPRPAAPLLPTYRLLSPVRDAAPARAALLPRARSILPATNTFQPYPASWLVYA